jgi:hypothetical protein
VARPGHVRLLRVVGLSLGQRPAGLRGEQEDLSRPVGEQPLELRRAPDVRRLDARAALLEAGQLLTLGRVPVVGEDDRVPRVQRQLRQFRADVPRSQNQERRPFKFA